MNYYRQKQLIAQVNKDDHFIKPIEKWTAHKKGILHRAFTVALFYKERVILQHRKHPAFDSYFDLACSSHPLYKNNQMQDLVDSVYETLKREWGVSKNDLLYKPKNKGFVIYKARDVKGGFVEHELCYLYISEIRKMPTPNFDLAYGFSLIPKEVLYNQGLTLQKLLAPWVKKILDKKLL